MMFDRFERRMFIGFIVGTIALIGLMVILGVQDDGDQFECAGDTGVYHQQVFSHYVTVGEVLVPQYRTDTYTVPNDPACMTGSA